MLSFSYLIVRSLNYALLFVEDLTFKNTLIAKKMMPTEVSEAPTAITGPQEAVPPSTKNNPITIIGNPYYATKNGLHLICFDWQLDKDYK